jgi:hypothetical protein
MAPIDFAAFSSRRGRKGNECEIDANVQGRHGRSCATATSSVRKWRRKSLTWLETDARMAALSPKLSLPNEPWARLRRRASTGLLALDATRVCRRRERWSCRGNTITLCPSRLPQGSEPLSISWRLRADSRFSSWRCPALVGVATFAAAPPRLPFGGAPHGQPLRSSFDAPRSCPANHYQRL